MTPEFTRSLIEEIIEIILGNVSCDHQPGDEYGRGGSVDYSLDNEKKVMKKCLALIMKPQVKEEWIEERALELHGKLYPNLGTDLDMLELMMDFIRSFIKELSDKINLKGDEK